jgi:hypothetical protein
MRAHYERQVPISDPIPRNAREPASFSDLLRQSLHCVLIEQSDREPEEAKLRVALRDLCERARGDGLRAENLLIMVKDSWHELPERARMPRHDADDALARVVCACIKEYYQDNGALESDSPSRCIREADRIHTLAPSADIQ